MTMIEKVARAIYEQSMSKGDFKDMARAAIEAMKEPTNKMIIASGLADYDGYTNVTAYKYMIDAALKEGK